MIRRPTQPSASARARARLRDGFTSDDATVARALGHLVLQVLAAVPGPARRAAGATVDRALELLSEQPMSSEMAAIIEELQGRILAAEELPTAGLERALRRAARDLDMSDEEANALERKLRDDD